MIYSAVCPMLLVHLPWLLICNVYIYIYMYCFQAWSDSCWHICLYGLVIIIINPLGRRNSAVGLRWFMREHMPSPHWMKERRSNIDIYNRRGKKRCRDPNRNSRQIHLGQVKEDKNEEIRHKCSSFFLLLLTMSIMFYST